MLGTGCWMLDANYESLASSNEYLVSSNEHPIQIPFFTTSRFFFSFHLLVSESPPKFAYIVGIISNLFPHDKSYFAYYSTRSAARF